MAKYKIGDLLIPLEELRIAKDFPIPFKVDAVERKGKSVKYTQNPGVPGRALTFTEYTMFEREVDHEATEKLAKDWTDETWDKVFKKDNVNHPNHYNMGKLETIEIIKEITQHHKGFEAYCIGNAVKYLSRAPFKGSYDEDVNKAAKYLEFLKDYTEEKKKESDEDDLQRANNKRRQVE